MDILIIAATEKEIEPVINLCQQEWTKTKAMTFTEGEVTVKFLITGVGMLRTSFSLGKALFELKPQLCINAGIAGAFSDKFKIGDVVHVVRDCIPELGATDAEGELLTLADMGLTEDISSTDGLINAEAGTYDFLPTASGITVNTVHGDEDGIKDIQKAFTADIETMESAAVFYCCLKTDVPFLAIRAISNMVEPRDRSKWNIPLAINNLNVQLKELLELLVAGTVSAS